MPLDGNVFSTYQRPVWNDGMVQLTLQVCVQQASVEQWQSSTNLLRLHSLRCYTGTWCDKHGHQ